MDILDITPGQALIYSTLAKGEVTSVNLKITPQPVIKNGTLTLKRKAKDDLTFSGSMPAMFEFLIAHSSFRDNGKEEVRLRVKDFTGWHTESGPVKDYMDIGTGIIESISIDQISGKFYYQFKIRKVK